MSFLAAIAIGFSEIFSHKFRSFLSMLGVVLGVSSLIATLAGLGLVLLVHRDRYQD